MNQRKYEEPGMIDRYWSQVGGTMAREFTLVRPSKKDGRSIRRADAVIVLNGEHICIPGTQLDVTGKDIVVVQAKKGLGMNVLGQAFFSRELMKSFEPASIRTVVLCQKDDSALRPIAEAYNIEVVIDNGDAEESHF